jgi:hypothetical protein
MQNHYHLLCCTEWHQFWALICSSPMLGSEYGVSWPYHELDHGRRQPGYRKLKRKQTKHTFRGSWFPPVFAYLFESVLLYVPDWPHHPPASASRVWGARVGHHAQLHSQFDEFWVIYISFRNTGLKLYCRAIFSHFVEHYDIVMPFF